MGGVNPIQEVKNLGSSIDDRIIQPALNDPIETAAVIAAAAIGGPIAAGATKTAFELDDGKELGDALKSGATTAATVYVGQELTGGTDYNYDVEAQPGGFYGESSAPIVDSVAIPASEAAYPTTEVGPTYTPAPGSLQDYLQQTGTIPAEGGATAGAGTFEAAIPELTSAAAAPSLLTVKDALDSARLASKLFGSRQQPSGPQQPFQPQQYQPGAVDYSNYLSLLAMRPQQRSNSLI